MTDPNPELVQGVLRYAIVVLLVSGATALAVVSAVAYLVYLLVVG